VQVILRENVDRLGHVGDIVTVAAGYARNYLLPQKLAVQADSGKVKQIEHEQRVIHARQDKIRQEFEQLAKRIESASCTIAARAGEEDKLFGSVGATDIAEALAESGIEIDRRWVQLEEPIKELGIFSVTIAVAKGVEARLKLWVVKQ
jgi:large subunit ribosomal protein L9